MNEQPNLQRLNNRIIYLNLGRVQEFSNFDPNGNYPDLSVGNAAEATNAINAQSAQTAVAARRADTADRATNDGDGINIVQTYLKKIVGSSLAVVNLADGTPGSLPYSISALANSLLLRDQDGRAQTNSPANSNDIVNLLWAVSNLLSNRGDQFLDGSLSISGDLNVQGTTTTTDTQTATVKEQYIVTNSDGAPLTGYAGLIIRVNEQICYGILYDNVDESVKIGSGIYDSVAGTFTFNTNEAQSLATRADTIKNDSILIWDADRFSIKDSEKTLADLVAVTDYNQYKEENSQVQEQIKTDVNEVTATAAQNTQDINDLQSAVLDTYVLTITPDGADSYDLSIMNNPNIVIGHFTNFGITDLRSTTDGWKVYIKQINANRICLRFENEYLIAPIASRILYIYLSTISNYTIQVNNDANQGFWDIRVSGSSTPSAKGASQTWFDYAAGYAELLLDMSIAQLDQVQEFRITSALIQNYSTQTLSRFSGTFYAYPEI